MDQYDNSIKKINNINNINKIKLHKMIFIFNALENGWSIKKNKEKYVFQKKHNNEKEIFLDNYLNIFIKNNI